ncbi:MAG: MerR family transcriptional regulator [Bradyrhizobiaceae bacterium]|nr:MerR family transcriptional regulator [Bradyrhizobiaceae bacterium]
MEKGPDAFRTISEVAEDLDLPQHVLRFWETRFAQIKPLKRGGGRRYYRPEDIELLRGIRQLLYGDGYTIRGVQQILREQGVRHVQAIGREAETVAPAVVPSGPAKEQRPSPARSPEGAGGLIDLLPSLRSPRPAPELPRVVEVPLPQRPSPATSGEDDDMPPFPFRRPAPAPAAESIVRPPVRPVFDDEAAPAVRAPAPVRHAEARPAVDAGKLSPEAIRLLKATLFELGECKRLLDTSRDER